VRERAAIVTGGGTGIGRAAALALHRDGFNIVVAGRRPEPLEGTRELAGEGCVVHPGDIREPEVSEALVERCL
jgi:NAD(P)-dependent dehydrogenase (short-subunit alcohol dehydrogenase family)